MSALPVEEQPSGAVPADTGSGPRGRRSRPGGATPRPAVHPLFPARKWLLPDGDCIFPGGGRSFSGRSAPGDVRSARPGSRPGPSAQQPAQHAQHAQQPGRPSADARRSSRPLQSVPVLSGSVVAGPGQPRVSPHRLRLTRRGRIVLAVLAVLTVCGLFVAGASAAQASGPTAAHGTGGAAQRVIVQPGDTLWSIAQSAAPNADARTIVQEILQANRLTTASISAGQRLWVPRG
jgi:LysM domain